MTHTCTYCRTTFGIHLAQCPNCGTVAVDAAPEIPMAHTHAFEPVATRLPNSELATRVPAGFETSVPDRTEPFRPAHRPAAASLCVLFDGDAAQGIWHWVHNDETIIGRGDVDVSITHDPTVAERHAALVRGIQNGQPCWLLRSLDLDAGVFVRTDRAALDDGSEFLTGSHRWRFNLPKPDAVSEDEERSDEKTHSWRALSEKDLTKLVPSLVEITQEGDGRTFPLRANGENRIGRDQRQTNIVVDDPFVDQCHVLINQDEQTWFLRDMGTTNGTWLRVTERKLDDQAEFQLGEQRFRFVAPNAS